jgi:CHAD domain-containing protein
VRDGHISLRFRELEIEQLNADEETFKELERLVRQAGARDHDGRPKLFRALSLPIPELTTPPKADAPVREHFTWTLTRHVRWLMAHDPGTRLGAESESLHQMRVAVRRLRSVLRAAKSLLAPGWTAPLSDELAWLGECLGRVRDLDVQIAYFRGELTSLEKPDRAPLKQLVTYLETQRAHAQQALLSELTSARYFDLIHRLEQAAHDPPLVESADSKMLKRLARREFKKLRKAIRRLEPEPRNETLHAIRIKTKRARYAAELAAPVMGKAAARFIKQASTVQDVLGAYQDAVTAELYIRSFCKASSSARAAFVAGRLIERQRQRRETLRKELPALFKALLKRGKQAWE